MVSMGNPRGSESPLNFNVILPLLELYTTEGPTPVNPAFVIALIMWIATVAVATVLLSTVEHAPIEWAAVFEILGGALLGLVLYAILGVAIGALITNQVAAIVIALVWIFVVEALLTVFVDWIGKWLPGGALNSILQATNTSGFGGTDALSVPAAALVLISYTVVLSIAAIVLTNRKDIT